MPLLYELIVCGMGLLFVLVVMAWIACLDMAAERARLKTWRWADLAISIDRERDTMTEIRQKLTAAEARGTCQGETHETR